MSIPGNSAGHVRILILSNLYPPFSLGGYELACRDVAMSLRRRGHRVTVLTSVFGLSRPQHGAGVLRALWQGHYGNVSFRWPLAVFGALWNRLLLRQVARRSRPDVILVFNPGGLGGMLLSWLHGQGIPVVHDISDTGLLRIYSEDTWYAGRKKHPHLLKQWLRFLTILTVSRLVSTEPRPLNLHRSYFRSRYLAEQFAAARGPTDPTVIHHAVPQTAPARDPACERSGIVFSGRLCHEKGVHILLEAIVQLGGCEGIAPQRVTIVGPAVDAAYKRRLQDLADRVVYPFSVRFTGPLPHDEAMETVREHAIFAFPVLWEEPFSIVLLEALRDGLAVVATLTGGSAEILRDGENCLVVPADNAMALANSLLRLLTDDPLRGSLQSAGPASVMHLSLDRSIDRVEQHLQRVVGLTAPCVPR